MVSQVSFKDYRFRDKLCVSVVMGCIAFCGVLAADRYVKNDVKGACAGAVGVGINTLLAAKCTQLSRKKARHRIDYKREHS